MTQQTEIDAMRRALMLAAGVLGSTSPNPPVGCVILDSSGNQVGEGSTAPPGGPHAEVTALRRAGAQARGGTAVVTLEPCSHHGRTPPCTRALLEAGIARVVFAVVDPHPLAAGGAAALQAAGIDVEGGVLEAEAARVNEAWLTFVKLRRPFVTWLFGSSLDGRVAASDGSSEGIEARAALRAERARLYRETDAVLATATTSPLRGGSGRGYSPLPGGLQLSVQEAEAAARDPRAFLQDLYARDVCSLLLDCAADVAGTFVSAGLVDRVIGYVAPLLLGGGGLPALAGAGAASLDAAPRFRFDEVSQIGTDLRVVARRRTGDDG